MSILEEIKNPTGTLTNLVNEANEKLEGTWTPLVRYDNAGFAEMAALVPHGYHFATDKWLKTIDAIFAEYPQVSGRAKLRLIYQRAADEGMKPVCNKIEALLKTIDEGETTSYDALKQLQEWAHRTYHRPHEHRVQAFLKYIRENELGEFVNPVDALEHQLIEHDLHWGELETHETLRNAVLYCIRRDLNYVAMEELTDKRARSWRKYLNNEWSKSAKEEYQKRNIKGRLWYKLKHKNNGKRVPSL